MIDSATLKDRGVPARLDDIKTADELRADIARFELHASLAADSGYLPLNRQNLIVWRNLTDARMAKHELMKMGESQEPTIDDRWQAHNHMVDFNHDSHSTKEANQDLIRRAFLKA